MQTFRAEELVAASCPPPAHVLETSLRHFFQQFELDRAAHMAIAERAKNQGLAFVATPFSLSAVEMLVDVGVDALKIASGDITYDGLIAAAADTGLPLIMSTGMSTMAETAHAVAIARDHGARSIALLHCVSSYPVPEGSENLGAVQTLAHLFDVPVGLSDHARDTFSIPIIIALGASIYERHLMLSGDTGVDAAVSSTPIEFEALVELARRTQLAIGHGRRECLPAEAVNLTASRRALHSTRAMASGHTIERDDIAVLRPSRGLSPALQEELVGTVIQRPIEAGAPFVGHDLPSVRSQRGAA
jgi:sialic acid synthase SpsE